MGSALDFASFKQTVLKSQDMIRDRIQGIEKMCSMLKGDTQLRLVQPGEPVESPAVSTSKPGPQKRINVAMLAELERTSSVDIIIELQRRLGMANLEETGVPLAMMDEELQSRVKSAEAFQTLGVPQPD